MKKKFTKALRKVVFAALSLGINVKYSDDLDEYYKGDMDGENIWITSELDTEEVLFNILHMIGHTIQWSVSDGLRELGNKLYENPSDELIRALQEYEWEANCYALQLLHDVGVSDLDTWLFDKYQKDMYYLTHFYKTGEKKKEITETALQYGFTKLLKPKKIPKFTVKPSDKGTRNGIVI